MRWIEVSVDVLPSQVEIAGDLLLRHCPQGFSEIGGLRRGRRVLRAYLLAGTEGRVRLRRLRRAVVALAARSDVRTRVVRDTGWAEAWKAYARPIRIGRLLVQPTWLAAPAGRSRGQREGGAVVRLDPGMAFGSGEHASTQLCLAAIDRYAGPGSVVIDLGTGSGILAIAAARLGARHVLAIDNDPLAVTVARANVRRNRVGRRISVRRSEGLAGLRLRADLILANLTADILPSVLSDVLRCLAPGGRFVASGFGSPRISEVRRRSAAAGLRVVATQRRRGWCAVHAIAPAARRSTTASLRAAQARTARGSS